MSDAEDRAAALTLLTDWGRAGVVPLIDAEEMERILDSHKVGTIWEPNTAYKKDERVLPPERNGVWYRVIQPGTSQSGTRNYLDWPMHYGQCLVDGSSDPPLILEAQRSDAIFRAIPSDPNSVNVYDVRGAAREVVDRKLAESVQLIDSDDSRMSQITSNLRALRDRFRPFQEPICVVRA